MTSARHNASALRSEIEESLAKRAPAALTPSVKSEPERTACGIRALDDCLRGGLPVGAITELVGAECSGRTTIAQAYVAATIQNGNVAAWVDVEDVFDPESATRGGVDCERLLWVRCGPAACREQKPVAGSAQTQEAFLSHAGQSVPQGGGGSPHPRSEGRGMPQAIEELLSAQPRSGALPARRRDKSIGTPGAPNRPLSRPSLDRDEQVATDRLPPRRGEQLSRVVYSPRRAEPQLHGSREGNGSPAHLTQAQLAGAASRHGVQVQKQSWTPLDQALRATDLLLQAGGFSLVVLDLGSTPAEMSWRIPLASWFRFRAACERTRASVLLLTKHTCAKSSAELVVRMETGLPEAEGGVLTGISFRSEVERQRFQPPVSKVVPIRKPPQSERPGAWRAQATWAL